MNRLAEFAHSVFNSEENRIYVPKKRLIISGAILFFIAVFLLSVTNLYTAIITLPVILFWVYAYILFCKIWKSHRCSVFRLVVIPILSVAFSVLLKYLL